MKSSTTPNLHPYSDVIHFSFQSAHQHLLGQLEEAAGPPKVPPELEREIFETCAIDYPEFCTNLVLVSKAVYAWIDPVLIATVCITEDFQSGKLKSFLAKLTSGKNPSWHSHKEVDEADGILAICTGVENLVINTEGRRLKFFDIPQAGMALSRLFVNYRKHSSRVSRFTDFNRACLRNLTHLHLTDDHQLWPYYTGWEHLVRLTHLAFASASSQNLRAVIQVLPAIRYVALGRYYYISGGQHIGVVVNNSPYVNASWAVRVVRLGNIPPSDWERGARGKGDFWDVMEKEVERRLRDGDGSS